MKRYSVTVNGVVYDVVVEEVAADAAPAPVAAPAAAPAYQNAAPSDFEEITDDEDLPF